MIIEIDWNVHHSKVQRDYDKLRDYLVENEWYNVLRFTNYQVENDLNWVILSIKAKMI